MGCVRSGSEGLAGRLALAKAYMDICLTLAMSPVRSPALRCGFVVYFFLSLFSYSDTALSSFPSSFLLPMPDLQELISEWHAGMH